MSADRPKLVQRLVREPGFYLCGSQKLGIADADSDWDFVATYSHNNVALLELMGFQCLTKGGGSYEGSYIHSAWQRQDADACVQVTLEVDVRYKLAIMRAMTTCPELAAFDRGLRGQDAVRDRLWAALYGLAGFEAPKPLGDSNDPWGK